MKKMLEGIEQTKEYDKETGLTTLRTSIAGNVQYENVCIPDLPMTTGSYVLKFTLAADGSKSFAWVAA